MVKYRVWLSILLIVSILSGCSFTSGNDGKYTSKTESKDTLGLTPDFSYEVVEQTPNIMINQVGYLTDSNKTAILRGKSLKNEFYVYHALTHKEVMKGSLKASGEKKQEKAEQNQEEAEEKMLYLADFSELETPGTYYIYHPDLGYSYEFKIGNQIYDEIEKKTLSILEEETNDTSLLCYQLASLFITKELYHKNLLEPAKLEVVCREKIQYLLQAQDSVTGNVYADISMVDRMNKLEDNAQKQPYISLAATAEFAGVMAFYAFQIRETDGDIYQECLKAAEKAYRAIQKNLDNVGYDAGYFAASQLYRLTNKSKYENAIGQYLAMKEEQKSYTEYDFSLFADYAYITVPSGGNLEWSEDIMKKIMSDAEEISLLGGKNNYYVSSQREYNDVDGNLQDILNMALVNYIITNHEYTLLQKNYLDYFLGRNPQNFCYMDGFGSRNSEETGKKISQKNSGLFYLLLQSTKI